MSEHRQTAEAMGGGHDTITREEWICAGLARHAAICRSCGARIVFATTLTGKAMPVDRKPHPDGNVRLSVTGASIQAAVLAGPDLVAARAAHRPLHRAHFASCTHPERHRRPRR